MRCACKYCDGRGGEEGTQALVGNSVSKMPIRKHILIWDNNIKMDFI
jgi:hypothetical protein